MNLSEEFKKRLSVLSGIQTEQSSVVLNKVKQLIYKVNTFEDCINAIRFQYGNVVPLFHATTPEKAILIDREGLKLTYGKNYKHFGEQLNLYFQIGKSDYHSSERSTLYRWDAPIEFIYQYCNADTDSISISEEEVNEIIGRDLQDRSEIDSYDAEIFIHAFVNNDSLLEGLELIATSETVDGFPIIKPIKIHG